MNKIKALALLSGGLDGLLAAKIVQNLGVEVIGLHFYIPFSRENRDDAEKHFSERLSGELGMKIEVSSLGREYLDVVRNPRYGYGKNMNPCIDCKIFMMKKAGDYMKKINACFIVTGEVAGQRPMSQNKQALRLIEKNSGWEKLIVRPLSAKILPVTVAEEKGWINREKLFAICGRGRKEQIELAQKLGIKNYPWPGGGCLLTESQFCGRVKDLIAHNSFNEREIELSKLGRYFRLSDSSMLIVGRNEKENERLAGLCEQNDIYFEPQDLPGPLGIGRGYFNEELKILSSRIIARYTSSCEVKVTISHAGRQEVIGITGIEEDELNKFRV